MNINWRVRIKNKAFWLALIPAVLLFHGIADETLFHIVADHGAGEHPVPQRHQAAVDVFCRLNQVKSHVGNFLISGQVEITVGLRDFFVDLLIHFHHPGLLYPGKGRLSISENLF